MIVFMRILAVFILMMGYLLSVGCVTTVDGQRSPLTTEKGRKEAIQAYIDLAYGYVREGQTEQAKGPLLEASKLDASNADVSAALAYIFQLERDPILAEQYFKKALSESNNNTRILNNYGAFLVQQNRLDDAKLQFLKASEDPFYAERSMVFENLGLVTLQQGHLKAAEGYFQRALLLNRDRVRSILSLADVYYQQGNFEEAQRYYNAFISATDGRQSPASLVLGIRIANAVNNKIKATSYLSELQQLYPNSPEYKAYKAGKK